MSEVVVELPTALRPELKAPMGPVFTETSALLAEVGDIVVAVGDMVSYHLLEAGRVPDVALVDGKTERDAVDADVREATTGFAHEITVENPAATLTADLLAALQTALERADEASTLLVVEGEEDLAVVPAVIAAPEGASIVYGQPGEGMVHVRVRPATVDRAREILSQMDGDTEQLWQLLDAPA